MSNVHQLKTYRFNQGETVHYWILRQGRFEKQQDIFISKVNEYGIAICYPKKIPKLQIELPMKTFDATTGNGIRDHIGTKITKLGVKL